MADPVHDAKRLAELQALPLEKKIQITQTRIIEWYQHYNGQVCVSFSGGKDSTVLLHIARRLYPNIRAVYSNTSLEYPEIQKFVKSFDNIDIVTPQMRFDEVISVYGYPLISKEVAEAIYYARRIRSQNSNVERERENQGPQTGRTSGETDWKRLEIGGAEQQTPQGQADAPQTERQTHQFIKTGTARNRRTVLMGALTGPLNPTKPELWSGGGRRTIATGDGTAYKTDGSSTNTSKRGGVRENHAPRTVSGETQRAERRAGVVRPEDFMTESMNQIPHGTGLKRESETGSYSTDSKPG